MNDAIAAIALGRRIDLTREADFILCGVQILPTVCEVDVGGRRIRLQPRVMQVLVALARADGEAVSRESLSDVCWGEVNVGDDALNRCIQKLRRLAEEDTGGAFVIETIPRLGYRLAPAGPLAPSAEVNRPRTGRWRYWSVVAGGLVAIAALVIAGALAWNARPAHWSIERSERLVSTPLLEQYPAISPDGTMLAYSAGADAHSHRVYLKRLSGGESIQLTNDTFDDVAPSWSPDGAQIAYVASRTGQPCRIMVMPVPAGLAREIGRCRTSERSRAVWSHDGGDLLFVDAAAPGAAEQVMSLDLATGKRQAITHPPGGVDDIEPAVSPDGRWLLFPRGALPDQVRIHDLKTGRERLVAQLPQGDDGEAWAEDSKSIFVVGENTQGWGIWSYPIDGGPRSALIGIGLPLGIGRLASGRGGLLAAEIQTGRYDVVKPPGARDAPPIVVDPAIAETWTPAYAPDGTLAMASNRSGRGAVWLMRPGGPARMLLDFNDLIPFGMAWSPDGTELAFVTLGPAINVRVVSAEGEDRAKIPVIGTEAGVPAWIGDGRALVIPVRDRGGWRLWRADLAHPGKPYPVTGYGWAAVRTVGDVLYGVRPGQPGIWRLGPTPRKITDRFSGKQREDWTIFKNQIVFADESDPNHPALLSAPLAGGPERRFASIPGADDFSFTIDPRSGGPVYVAGIDLDWDIELFHLARR